MMTKTNKSVTPTPVYTAGKRRHAWEVRTRCSGDFHIVAADAAEVLQVIERENLSSVRNIIQIKLAAEGVYE